jgi:hypothetical protein
VALAPAQSRPAGRNPAKLGAVLRPSGWSGTELGEGAHVDPVTIGAVLAAIAGGAGGTLGSQLWAGLSALVRRPFHRSPAHREATATLPSGAAELAALEQAPDDERRALALAGILVARADADSEFSEALAAWWEQASPIHIGADTTNTISGGTFHGP